MVTVVSLQVHVCALLVLSTLQIDTPSPTPTPSVRPAAPRPPVAVRAARSAQDAGARWRRPVNPCQSVLRGLSAEALLDLYRIASAGRVGVPQDYLKSCPSCAA